ncbi:MAG TPA: RibD family protein, partial [Minicystis sp.]|nr:RibD family protein [Minicystis sp.]
MSDGATARASRGAAAEPSRPHVTLHYAQSLDGRIATRTGAARWISGEAATRFAHELRAAAGAVVIGSGTALADDPQLTVRLVAGRHPLRVVLDARGRLPASSRLARDGAAPTVVATCA